MPLDERVRWIAAAWVCLGIPLMSLWLWAWTRSIWAAGVAGADYAVALAALMRSTGQELQHENFALPFLIAHWALGALANRTKGRRAFFIAALFSALMLACAVSAWDLIQYYIILWGIWSYVRFVAGGYCRDHRACLAWWLTLWALVGAGVLNPYLRVHAFAGSFAMLLAYGVALCLGAERLFRIGVAVPVRAWIPSAATGSRPQLHFRRTLGLALTALLPLIAGALWIHAYGETY